MLNQFRNQNGELQREKGMILVPNDTWRIKKKCYYDIFNFIICKSEWKWPKKSLE